MIKKVFCLLLFCVVALVAAAQEVEFTADRPGASTGPATVGQKVIQLEQGIQYDGVGDGYGQFTFSNTLLRYGLFDGVELRLGGDALIHHTFDKWQPVCARCATWAKIALWPSGAKTRKWEPAIPSRAWNLRSAKSL